MQTQKLTFGLLTGVALMLGVVLISMSGTANADTCARLQVSGVEFIDHRVIQEGNAKVGVAAVVKANVKNTDRKQVYVGNNQTQVSIWYTDENNRRVPAGNFYMKTHIAPGGSQKVTSERMVLRRKPREGLTRTIGAGTFNMHCGATGNNYVDSQFVYDLTPVLTGGKPKRLSGRIKGASSSNPPPKGSGAPAPRR